MGFNIEELDYGDRFFSKESSDSTQTYNTKQYIHIASVKEVIGQIRDVGLEILDFSNDLQMSKTEIRRNPPYYFVCRK